MIPSLIPQPRQFTRTAGAFHLPSRRTLGIEDARLHPVVRPLLSRLGVDTVAIARPSLPDTIRITFSPRLRPGGYQLLVRTDGIRLTVQSVEAARSGLETLLQWIDQADHDRLPCCRIDDWPEFAQRGVYYDCTRGRVPHLGRLQDQADLLSRFKINHLQYYIEHTFQFRNHPLIGRGASPLSPDDVLTMDAFCRDRGIELVPSFASFGHMVPVLSLPPYRHLAEDWGVGRYLDPAVKELPDWSKRRAWSLSPANPAGYRFLDSLYAEFLPLFTSRTFNACCDETYDLGLGQSFPIAQRKGKGRLYLDHVRELARLAAGHGKRLMIWGDIVHHYPELIPSLPRNLTVLDWGYTHDHPFDRVSRFQEAGVPFLVCPGTSSWVSLFPRLHEAAASIHGYAAAARRHGAAGILNTDWGDRGHFNFMEFSWHGYLLGAESAWNPDADARSFTRRFARLFLGSANPAVASAIDTLGDVAHLSVQDFYQSAWYHLFFARPNDPVFAATTRRASVASRGKIRRAPVALNAALGHDTLARLATVRAALRNVEASDPHAVLPYWLFAIDTIAHAARKLTVLGAGGRDTPRARAALADEMHDLLTRFTRLWLDRNRPSEMRNVVRQYRTTARALKR